MKTADQDVKKTHKIASTKVKDGDVMAIVTYVKVKKNENGDRLQVTNLDSGGIKDFSILGKDLIEICLSADQYSEEIEVSKTAAAEILISSYNRPLTVCFEKSDKSERVLRGRFIRHEALLGRSMVEDLDEDEKNRIRLVDHRTILYITVDGVKYKVK